ncbi:MAG: recombinase family protein [Pseudomonadota bacterium]
MMKTAVYMRISDASQSTDTQEPDLKRWLAGNGIDDAQWFKDTISGDTWERSALDDLNAAVFNGEVTTIIVWKLDRIGRTLREGINQLGDWTDRGVRVVSVTQQLDLSGKVGEIIAAVLFGVAAIELENNRERQAAGIAVAKEKGVYTGRKAGTLKADPARAKDMKARGMKPGEIMKALGIKSRTTLSKYLNAET